MEAPASLSRGKCAVKKCSQPIAGAVEYEEGRLVELCAAHGDAEIESGHALPLPGAAFDGSTLSSGPLCEFCGEPATTRVNLGSDRKPIMQPACVDCRYEVNAGSAAARRDESAMYGDDFGDY